MGIMSTTVDLEKLAAETLFSIREMRDSQRESQKETDRLVRELVDSQKGLTKTVDHWVGRFGNYIGNIVEMVLVPGISEQMNKHGHVFTTLSPRKVYRDHKDGSVYAEVDLFLENGVEVMVVEVKTNYEVKDINTHLKRLQKLRSYEDRNGLKGKIILSAIA